jgi:hypothetical protein
MQGPPAQYLPPKQAGEPEKSVWMGGSTTEARAPAPCSKRSLRVMESPEPERICRVGARSGLQERTTGISLNQNGSNHVANINVHLPSSYTAPNRGYLSHALAKRFKVVGVVISLTLFPWVFHPNGERPQTSGEEWRERTPPQSSTVITIRIQWPGETNDCTVPPSQGLEARPQDGGAGKPEEQRAKREQESAPRKETPAGSGKVLRAPIGKME